MKIIGAIVMISAAIYGAVNILNGTYRRHRRATRPVRMLGIIIVLIAVIFHLLSGRSLKW